MKNRIHTALNNAADQYNIEILYACESGSRAWGFPSPDSDYDVRFIYKRMLSDYLSVQDIDSNISFPITEKLDLYGWDLRKVLQLLYKSNSTPFEWLQSPIIYQEKPGFRESIADILPSYFDPKTQLFHYLGIAKGAMESMDRENIKIKKLFYILRPLLAAKWIIVKSTYPPMNITHLLGIAPENIKEIIEYLISRKLYCNEAHIVKPAKELIEFIEDCMRTFTEEAGSLTKKQFDISNLNHLFQKCIQ